MASAIPLLTLATALGCLLIAGVFFAFSVFVMRALGRLPAASGIAAMQAINVAVLHPGFLAPFLGTAAAALVLGVHAVLRWHEPGAALRLAGALLYGAGCFGVTAAANVPRNEALARVDPASAEGARLWQSYLRAWTAWNHVRTLAAFAAGVALLIARTRG